MAEPNSPHPFVVVRDDGAGLDRLVRPVVAIGNFDGVHRGHRAVIGTAMERAQAAHRPAAVLTFEPHPRTFFQPGRAVVPPHLRGRQAPAAGRDRARRRDRAHLQRGAGRAQRRGVRRAHPGGPARHHRRGDRLQLPFRQGRGAARRTSWWRRAPTTASRSMWCRRSSTTAGGSPPARCAMRWRPAMSPRRPSCSAIRGSSPRRWSTATSAAGRSAIRPPTCGSAPTAASSTASMRCGSASAARATTGSRASAAGRRSTPARCCSRSSCSISPATSMARRSTCAFIGWIRPEMNFDSVEDLIRRMDQDCQPGAAPAGAGAGRVSAAGQSRLNPLPAAKPPATHRAMTDKPGEPKSGERDYSQTLFLPQTEFPMRAGLPQKEPELLERWQKLDLYKRLREAAKGRDEVRAARRPALRQRQHPHRPRAQQDPEGRGDAQPADARLRLQLRAGLGLPRPADRMEDRGRELPLQEQAEAEPVRPRGDDRVPQGMPRLCRALARRAARGVQAARRRGRLGSSLHDDELSGRGADRARADEVRRERHALSRLASR